MSQQPEHTAQEDFTSIPQPSSLPFVVKVQGPDGNYLPDDDDEQAPSGDLPLSFPGFDNGPGNSTFPGGRRPDLRLDTSSFLSDFSNITDNSNPPANGLLSAEMLALQLWANEAGRLSPGPHHEMLWSQVRQGGFHSPTDASPSPSPFLSPSFQLPFLDTDTSSTGSEYSPLSAPPVSLSSQWPQPTENSTSFGQGIPYSPAMSSPYLVPPASPIGSLPPPSPLPPDAVGLKALPQAYSSISAPATPVSPASDSFSDASSYYANSPRSDGGPELSQYYHHRTPSLPINHSPRPGRSHNRNASHPYLPYRSRSQPGGVTRDTQDPSEVIPSLALERQYAPGPFLEGNLVGGVGSYTHACSSSVSLSDELAPSLSRIELDGPGPSGPVVARTGAIKDRIASAAHLRKTMERREKVAAFFCEWPNCGQDFTTKHRWKSHMRSHTGERPYRCEACGAGFTTTDVLRRHHQTCKQKTSN